MRAKVEHEAEDAKGYRIVRTEEAVFAAQPEATHFRYPYVYGPYQLVPREWCIVRRVLDRRPLIVLPEDGLTLHHHGYAENLAHAVLLGVDHPERAPGQIYHCADEEVLTLAAGGRDRGGRARPPLEIVSMPWRLAVPARPLLAQPLPTHRVFDLGKIRASSATATWCPRARRSRARRTGSRRIRPLPAGRRRRCSRIPSTTTPRTGSSAAWRRALAALPEVEWERAPGYTLSYSGPGGRARAGTFVK